MMNAFLSERNHQEAKKKCMKNLVYRKGLCSEARKELIRMGYMSVPVLIIDGEHVLGFDLKRMEMLLDK